MSVEGLERKSGSAIRQFGRSASALVDGMTNLTMPVTSNAFVSPVLSSLGAVRVGDEPYVIVV